MAVIPYRFPLGNGVVQDVVASPVRIYSGRLHSGRNAKFRRNDQNSTASYKTRQSRFGHTLSWKVVEWQPVPVLVLEAA